MSELNLESMRVLIDRMDRYISMKIGTPSGFMGLFNQLEREIISLRSRISALEDMESFYKAEPEHRKDQLNENLDRILAYRESLEWLVNLGYGKGKAGGEIEGGEFEEALESGKQALLAPSPVTEDLREAVKDLLEVSKILDRGGWSHDAEMYCARAISRLKLRFGL